MGRKRIVTVLIATTVVLAAPALAQEGHEMTPEQQAEMQAYMAAGTPGDQHQALAASAGTYKLSIKSWNEPGGPAMESTGTAVRTMALDGRVLLEELSSSMMGMPFTGHAMLGYDNVSGKYWSTWTDSMSTGVMVSEGSCDDKQTCSFTGSWNDPIKKGPVTATIKTSWTSQTTQLFEMYGPAKDGTEMKMMEMTYTKQ